ncbi:hypothetical protein ACFW1A_04615 [Kitasatospora sp. NPDC058965]|uniref:hypothetical protein n=1 Tax=Kitasatospora sp. NPDC058965 TaxID=3346682 RepID=UPI00367C51C7
MTDPQPTPAGPHRRLPVPDTSWWTTMLQRRTEAAQHVPAPPPPRPKPVMTRRSWYLDREVCESFSACVAEIHRRTGAPKHDIVAALLTAAIEHSGTVAEQFDRVPEPGAPGARNSTR